MMYCELIYFVDFVSTSRRVVLLVTYLLTN